MEELCHGEPREFFRPNFWPNTPDILHEVLQTGGRPMFEARLVLAATLSPTTASTGPPFELQEHLPRESGSEEYLDSEKYQQRTWDLDAPGSLAPLITRVNEIRRAHPALQRNDWLRFHEIDNDQLVAYSKRRRPSGDDAVFVIVSLDPRRAQAGRLTLALEEFGLDPERAVRGPRAADRPASRWPAGGERDVRSTRPAPPPRSGSSARDPGRAPGSARGRGCRASPRSPRGSRATRSGSRTRSSTRPHVRAFADSDADGVGRLPRPHREARLPPGPRRHRDLAAAVLPVAAQGRRLRHRRLHQRPSRLRHAARRPPADPRGAPARPAGHHRARLQPHLGPASLVPARTPGAPRAAPPASSTSGATRPIATRTPGSSSRTPSTRTGPGTRSPSSTSGIASSRTSPT